MESLLAASRAAADAGKLSQAESLAREAVSLATTDRNARLAADGQRRLGQVLIDRNRYPEAETVLQQSLATLEPLGQSESLAKTLATIALLYRYRADYPTALAWLRRAEQMFIALGDDSDLQQTYNSYGVIYDLMGEQDRALEWHSRSLELARELNDTPAIADGVYAIGEVHRALGEHDLALDYFRQSLALDEASGVSRNIAYSHIKVGATLIELGQLADARSQLETAYSLFAAINAPRDLQWARGNLAFLDALEGETDRAREELHDVLARSVAGDWPRLANHSREWLAKLEMRAGHPEKALGHLDDVLRDALEQKALRRALRIYEMRALCLESMGQPGEALAALRERDALEDTLFDSYRTSVIAALQGEAESERALELAQKEKALTELALEREAGLRLAGFAALGTLFLLSFLLYSRLLARRQNRRLSEEVREKTSTLVQRNTELEEAYRAVERASITDPLTGLANRRFLERHIDGDVARSRRLYASWDGSPEHRPAEADLVFFLIDMDHFKAINDRAGHRAGDAVLIEVSRLLEKEFRSEDFVLRWGGEEFLIIARFIDRRAASALAERVRLAVATHAFQPQEGTTLHCTCSIGFSALPLTPGSQAPADWQDVVEIADRALYAVKNGPRNGWQGYFAPRQATPERPLADWVPAALRSGELESISSFTTD